MVTYNITIFFSEREGGMQQNGYNHLSLLSNITQLHVVDECSSYPWKRMSFIPRSYLSRGPSDQTDGPLVWFTIENEPPWSRDFYEWFAWFVGPTMSIQLSIAGLSVLVICTIGLIWLKSQSQIPLERILSDIKVRSNRFWLFVLLVLFDLNSVTTNSAKLKSMISD